MSVNVAFSDAAAKTVSVPAAVGAEPPALDDADDAAAELDPAAEDPAADEPAAALVVEDTLPLLELQPTTVAATHNPVRTAIMLRRGAD